MRNSLHHNEEFEDFLKEQVNQHRMYPSDHVWRNIQENLHGTNRWPALTYIAIFLIVLLTMGTLVIKPHKQMIIVPSGLTLATMQTATKGNVNQNSIKQETLEEHLSPGNITHQTITAVIEKLAIKDSILSADYVKNDNIILSEKETTDGPQMANVKNGGFNKESLKLSSSVLPSDKIEKFEPSSVITHAALLNGSSYLLNSAPSLFDHSNSSLFKENNSLFIDNNQDWKTVSINRSINKRFRNLDFQFYITPSVSYRRLVDSKTGHAAQPFISGIPLAANYTLDLSQIAKHRPAMGTEVGFAVGYKLTNSLVLKTGFQFNIRRYNIEAYTYNTREATPAFSLMANPDSLGRYNVFQSIIPGSKPITLNNTYYEVSMPFGIDWRLLADGRITLNVAAAIQPTYTFDKEPFIITSDYKNYTDGSSLIRNWNINTNFETYISYKLGNFKWQIGPQFRYQLLPTLSTKYPIREYLMDYGLKVGFTKTIR